MLLMTLYKVQYLIIRDDYERDSLWYLTSFLTVCHSQMEDSLNILWFSFAKELKNCLIDAGWIGLSNFQIFIFLQCINFKSNSLCFMAGLWRYIISQVICIHVFFLLERLNFGWGWMFLFSYQFSELNVLIGVLEFDSLKI